METGTATLNVIAILLFFGLAAVAALVVMIVGKIVFGKWFAWVWFFLSSILGGLSGIAILVFGSKLEEVKADTSISSISSMIVLVFILILGMMIILPLMTMLLRQRRLKIRELENELKKLKENRMI